LATQYCDGLRGPYIIYDPHANLCDVDDGRALLLCTSIILIVFDRSNTLPPSAAALINGLGRLIPTLHPICPLYLSSVSYGCIRHRFCMVSMSCDVSFTTSIQAHNIFVYTISFPRMDGVNHMPYTVDRIEIFAGKSSSRKFYLNASSPILLSRTALFPSL
ncbi:uncharacterized protein BT62DRAFT_898977, partial [Guyanagaster necrorhizus]